MKIGYVFVSTNDQDLITQRNALVALGVEDSQIYVERTYGGESGAPWAP